MPAISAFGREAGGAHGTTAALDARSGRRAPAHHDAPPGRAPGRPPTQSGPPGGRARRLSGAAPARRHHERPAPHARARVVRRRRCVEDAVQHGLRGPPRHGRRRARRAALSRRDASRSLPTLAPGHRRRPACRWSSPPRRRSQSDPAAAIAYFRAALSLVEGEPLANALSGYAWWEAEGHGGRIAAVLVDAACAMASLASDAGLFDLARWGLEQARIVEPYSEALSRSAMELAAAEGDADRLRLEWRECQRRVDALDPGRLARRRVRSRSTASCPAGSSSVPRCPTRAPARAMPRQQRLSARCLFVAPRRHLRGAPPGCPSRGRRRPGPASRRSATASSALLTCAEPVEPGLVADHLDPELLGQPGRPCGARPRSRRPARPSARGGPASGRPAARPSTAAPPRSRPGWRCSSPRPGRGRRGRAAPPCAAAIPVAAPRAVTTPSNGTPHHSAAAAAASAFGTCCIPCSASRTSPAPHGVDNSKPRPKLVVEHDALRPHLGARPTRVAQDRTGADRGHARHTRVVEVQDGHARRRQRRHELALRPGHPVEVTEELHVRHGHAGHDADVRTTHLGQARDVTAPRARPSPGRPTRRRPAH